MFTPCSTQTFDTHFVYFEINNLASIERGTISDLWKKSLDITKYQKYEGILFIFFVCKANSCHIRVFFGEIIQENRDGNANTSLEIIKS